MTRIFGVQRTRNLDQLKIRNKMTGRIFFLRYPILFDFIYDQLKLATAAIERCERPMNLHPLLLLLGRLYPSALEGCESSMQLSAFLPFIVQCSVCPELETRRLAVKSIAALVAPNKLIDQILIANEMLHSQLLPSSTPNSNAAHGYLLQIQYLIEAMDAKVVENKDKVLTRLFSTLLDSTILFSGNYILIKIFVDILIDILVR